MASIPLDGGYGWVIVAAAACVIFIMNGTIFCFGLLFVEFIEYFQVSRTRASWIGLMLIMTFRLSSVVGSILTRRFGHRKIAIIGSIISGTGILSSYFTNSIEALYVTLGFMGGIGSGLAFISSMIIVNEYFDKKRPLAVGIMMCGGSCGYLLYPYIFKYLSSQGGWRICVVGLACLWIQTVVSGALYRPLRRTKVKNNSIKSIFEFSIIRDWRFHVYSFGYVFWSTSMVATLQSIPDNCKHLGYSKEKAGIVFSVIGIVAIPGRLIAGIISSQKWLNRTLYMSLILLLYMAVLIIYAFMANFIGLVVLTGFIGWCISHMIILQPLIASDVFGIEKMSSSYGYSQVYLLLSLAAGPLAAYAFDQTGNYIVSFLLLATFSFLSGALFFTLFLWERKKKKTEHEEESNREFEETAEMLGSVQL